MNHKALTEADIIGIASALSSVPIPFLQFDDTLFLGESDAIRGGVSKETGCVEFTKLSHSKKQAESWIDEFGYDEALRIAYGGGVAESKATPCVKV